MRILLAVLLALIGTRQGQESQAGQGARRIEVPVTVSPGSPSSVRSVVEQKPHLPAVRGKFVQVIEDGREDIREVTARGMLNVYSYEGRFILWVATDPEESTKDQKCWGYLVSLPTLGGREVDPAVLAYYYNGQEVELAGTRQLVDWKGKKVYEWRGLPPSLSLFHGE